MCKIVVLLILPIAFLYSLKSPFLVPFISTTAVDCDWCTTNLSHGCLWLSSQSVVGIISSSQRSVLVPIGFCVVLS